MALRKLNFTIFIYIAFIMLSSCDLELGKQNTASKNDVLENILEAYTIPDTNILKDDEWGNMVRYGARLVKNTAYYIGPEGTVSKNLRNKMNCSNCHLNSGTKPFGLNFFNSHKTYPQYRARENKILTLADRVNNCIERPHSGIPLKLDSKEMLAIVSYIKWIGEKYDSSKHEGYGLKYVNYKNLNADHKRGALVYDTHCKTCHQANGEGLMDNMQMTYVNPPLWGKESYQEGSSMHRVIKAASFIKYNMPNLQSSAEKPLLSDQEALDVAAFINDGSIHNRPKSKYTSYENINTKPIDYFKGPYSDGLSELQHAFGPWDEIENYYLGKKLKVHK
jgi:thiosulfate dehydrogenase